MTRLIAYVDIAIGNEEDAEKVFGIQAAGTDVSAGALETEGYEQVARALVDRFALKAAAITLRESRSADFNGWSAILLQDRQVHRSRKYDIRIVDRVGGGDAFAGGLIHGIVSGMSAAEALEFAVAASCLKHTVVGDANMVTVDEVQALLKGDGSGRVQR